jgi:hypothetical protein
VRFDDLSSLPKDRVDLIKRRGVVVIRDVVNDEVAFGWKLALQEYAKANPETKGSRIVTILSSE